MASLTAAFLVAGLAPLVVQKPATMPTWPALNGTMVWVSHGQERHRARTPASPAISPSGVTVTLKEPVPGLERAAVEFVVLVHGDGPIVTYRNQTIGFDKGSLNVTPGIRVHVKSAEVGQPLDLVFVTRATDVAIYANGEFFTSFGTSTPTKIAYPRSDWSTSLQGLATFDHPLSESQIERNAKAAQDFVHGFASGPPMATVDLELGEFTPVPDPARIKPYRNALLAEEYKVLDVVDGGSTPLKAGDKVRVFRWGVLDGKQTSVKNLKSGDRVRLKIEPMAAAGSGIQNEYQLDSLGTTSYDPYYVEVINS